MRIPKKVNVHICRYCNKIRGAGGKRMECNCISQEGDECVAVPYILERGKRRPTKTPTKIAEALKIVLEAAEWARLHRLIPNSEIDGMVQAHALLKKKFSV
jgi:NMD protein affecting ribosome stability and mRNA decay